MRRHTIFLLAGLTILVLPIAMCWRSPLFNKNYSYRALHDVQLIVDSPEVQRLLTEETGNIAEKDVINSIMVTQSPNALIELSQHPERLLPKHFEFLRAMARQSAEMVPKGTYARALKASKTPCGRIPGSRPYAMFRITDGPMKGHTGWACMSGDFSPTFGGP